MQTGLQNYPYEELHSYYELVEGGASGEGRGIEGRGRRGCRVYVRERQEREVIGE